MAGNNQVETEEPPNNQFADFINGWLEANNKYANDLADLAGVAPATISNWRNGAVNPKSISADMIIRLAHATGVSENKILSLISAGSEQKSAAKRLAALQTETRKLKLTLRKRKRGTA